MKKADEKALAKLLAAADEEKVAELMHGFRHYEHVVTEAKARLTRRNLNRPSAVMWLGGYANAMATITQVISEMAAATPDPRAALLAVADVAYGHRDLYYAHGVPESWAGDAS